MFALASRSVRAIASPTSSGTCEPPGASRKTKPPSRSDEKRARTASTSSRVAAMERAYPRVILGCGNFGGIGSAPAFFETGRDARAGARAHGRCLGGGHHVVRHRRRVRRRPQRDVHRRVDPLAPSRGAAHHDEDLQPDGRGRGSRPRAGARAPADRHEPPAPRCRARRPLPRARVGSGRPGRRGRRRLRGARRRREDRRLRSEQRRRRPAAGGARGRPVRRRPELVLAARPRGGGRGAAALRGARRSGSRCTARSWAAG